MLFKFIENKSCTFQYFNFVQQYDGSKYSSLLEYNGTGDDGFASYQRPMNIFEVFPNGKKNEIVVRDLWHEPAHIGDVYTFYNPRDGVYYEEAKLVGINLYFT